MTAVGDRSDARTWRLIANRGEAVEYRPAVGSPRTVYALWTDRAASTIDSEHRETEVDRALVTVARDESATARSVEIGGVVDFGIGDAIGRNAGEAAWVWTGVIAHRTDGVQVAEFERARGVGVGGATKTRTP